MSEPSPASGSVPAATSSIRPVVPTGVKSLLPFDILRVGAYTLRGWKWALLAGVLGGAGALSLGWLKFTTKYTVQVQLVRQETQNNFQASRVGESFQPRQFNAATVSSMMRANSLMEKTGATQKPPLSTGALQKDIVIKPEKNTDLITVAWTEEISREHAVQTINNYAENVVELTKVLQADEAKDLLGSITAQVERTESELGTVQRELMAYSKESKLFNAEKETESYLKQIGDLELKIETSRIEREAVDYRLTQAEQELAKQNPGMQRLKEARDKLGELLTQYTKKHPAVVEQQARVSALEKSTAKAGAAAGGDVTSGYQASGNTMANGLYMDILTQRALKESLWNQISSLQSYRDQLKEKLETIPDKNLAQVRIKSRATALDETRNLLAGRQREAQLFAENAPGYYRLFAPATVENVEVSSRTIKMVLVTAVGAIFAAGLVAALRALKAAMDDRIISPSDVRRLTRVQVIAALPPEENMDPASLARWQFSTWANLVKAIPAPPDGALILGLLSAEDGAGKSTWLRHLGRAALDRGLKVLAITHGESTGPAASSVPLTKGLTGPEKILTHLRKAEPAAVELNAPETWEWTAATRSRWRNALTVWSQEPRLVVLVELPAASKLDSLLLAETLPAILWLSDSGKHRREEVTGIIDTIRQSGVPLAGSLLNRIPPLFVKLPDLAKFGLCLAASLALATGPAAAQEDQDPPSPPPAIHGDLPAISLSAAPEDAPAAPVLTDSPTRLLPEADALQPSPAPAGEAPVFLPTPPEKRIAIPVPHPDLAPWQQRLTLGPGDQVNLQVYGHKEFARSNVPVGPDGTLSYLQVTGFPAAGKTIDELREGLTQELRKFIQNAQVIVTPGAFRSKKYFIMGTIMDRGAYTLDRPMTLLEAAARSRGIATGLQAQNTVEIADMRRAFIVRDGKKLDVDFNKLFYEGDTSRNIPLYPGDYIYFPSNTVNEVYILGAVASPGQTGVTESLTALGAITIRGGFSPAAWRKKVLIVRGTMDKAKPEVIEVNAAAILAGKQKDVLLEPRDLVYVSEKPWQKAAELFDTAVRSFVQTSTGTWIGQNIGPFLKEPLLPSIKNP